METSRKSPEPPAGARASAPWNCSPSMAKTTAPAPAHRSKPQQPGSKGGSYLTPASRLMAKLHTLKPGELFAGRHMQHSNYRDRILMGSGAVLPSAKEELYLHGSMSTHPGKNTEGVVVPDKTGLHPTGEAQVVPRLHRATQHRPPAGEDHLQVQPSGLSGTQPRPALGIATFPGGPGGPSHLEAARASVKPADRPQLPGLHVAPQHHVGKADHVLPRQLQGGSDFMSHTGSEAEPPKHDQRKFDAGRNHQAHMYKGHLGPWQTGLGMRVSQEEQPAPIAHAGRMVQQSQEAADKSYAGRRHAGQMVRESLGGFASWLTAPLPSLRGIRACGQAAQSSLHNQPHGLEADAGRYRRLRHGAEADAPAGGAEHLPPVRSPSLRAPPAATGLTSAAGRSAQAGSGSSSSSSSCSSSVRPSKSCLRAPWADWA